MVKKVTQLTNEEFMSMIDEAVANASKGMGGRSVSKNASTLTKDSFAQFKGITFKFFGVDGIGIVTHILFTFEQIAQLTPDKAILIGTVTFNNQSIKGHKIEINLNKRTAMYRANHLHYSLEIDNRTKPQWEALLSQL